MTPRVRAAGALVAVGYLAVVLLTRLGLPGHPRPLYDGFAPPAPYRWVNPPKALADTNEPPSSGTGHVDKSATDGQLAVQTKDTQANLTADIPTLGLTAAETGAGGELRPLDPTEYGRLPDGVAPSGNIYRLTVTAVPDNRAITAFTGPVSINLQIANTAGTDLYYSPDGNTWTKVPSTVGGPFVAANVRATGLYVLGGPAALLPTIESRRKPGAGNTLPLWIGAAVVAIVAVGAVLLVRRQGRAP